MYHRQSIELWLYKELFTINPQNLFVPEDFLHLLASATLVDFPRFRDIHYLIPQALDIRQIDTKPDYHQIEDSDKWEIYVGYRQIVSRYLIARTGCGIPPDTHNLSYFFSAWSRGGQENYVNLAKYLLSFLSKGLY